MLREDSVASLSLLLVILCSQVGADVELYSLSDGEIMTLPSGDDFIGNITLDPPFFFFDSDYSDIYVRKLRKNFIYLFFYL